MLLSIAVRITNGLADLAYDPPPPGGGLGNSPPPGGGGLENPPPQAPPGLDGVANQWIAYAKFASMLCGALGFFYCAIAMMIGRRNRSHLAGEGASGLLWVTAGLSVAAVAVPLAIQIMNASG